MNKKFYVQVSQMKPEWKVTNTTLIPVETAEHLDAKNINVYRTEDHDFVNIAGRVLLFDHASVHFCAIITMDDKANKTLHEVITLTEEYKEKYEGFEFNLGVPINGSAISARYGFAKKMVDNFIALGLYKKGDLEFDYLNFAKNPEINGFSLVNGRYAIYQNEVLTNGLVLLNIRDIPKVDIEYLTEQILNDMMTNAISFKHKYQLTNIVVHEAADLTHRLGVKITVDPNDSGILYIRSDNDDSKLAFITLTTVINDVEECELNVVGYSYDYNTQKIIVHKKMRIGDHNIRDAAREVFNAVKEVF